MCVADVQVAKGKDGRSSVLERTHDGLDASGETRTRFPNLSGDNVGKDNEDRKELFVRNLVGEYGCTGAESSHKREH